MPCGRPRALGSLGDQRESRREQRPEGDAGEHDEGRVERGARAGGQRQRAGAGSPAAPSGSGVSAPRRSLSRPTNGDSKASSAALTSHMAPIATAPQPSAASRSGASTESTPNSSEAIIMIARPAPRRGWRRPRASVVREGSPAGGASMAQRQHAPSTSARPASAAKITSAPGEVGRGPDDRAEQGADDRCAHRLADQLAAALPGGVEQPGERPGPGEGAAGALQDAGGQQGRVGVRQCEAEACQAHQRQTPEDRSAGPEAHRRPGPPADRRGEPPPRRRRPAFRRPPWRGGDRVRSGAASASGRRRASCPRARARRRASAGGASVQASNGERRTRRCGAPQPRWGTAVTGTGEDFKQLARHGPERLVQSRVALCCRRRSRWPRGGGRPSSAR